MASESKARECSSAGEVMFALTLSHSGGLDMMY
jgi:hypothetical protein